MAGVEGQRNAGDRGVPGGCDGLLIGAAQIVRTACHAAHADLAVSPAGAQGIGQMAHDLLHLGRPDGLSAEGHADTDLADHLADATDPHILHAGLDLPQQRAAGILPPQGKDKAGDHRDLHEVKNGGNGGVGTHGGNGEDAVALQHRADGVDLRLLVLGPLLAGAALVDLLNQAVQHPVDVLQPDGLYQEVLHIQAHGLLGVGELTVGGDDDEVGGAGQQADLPDHIQPVDAGQVDIHKNNVRQELPIDLQRLDPVDSGPDLLNVLAVVFEHHRQGAQLDLLILND